MEMEMEMEMESYMKDSNVGVGVVGGGVETPTDTANHKLAARVLPRSLPSLSSPQSIKFISSFKQNFCMHGYQLNFRILFQFLALLESWIPALIFGAVCQLIKAKGSWEINETNTTEKAIATRYYCHRCRHVVTVDVETSCPSCQGAFIQACKGVASLYLAMPSESELSESGSDGESTTGLYDSNPSGFVTLDISSCDVNNEVDEQRHEKRVFVESFCQLVFILGMGRFSVF